MRIFSAFLVIVTAAILFMLPLTSGVYDFRTDLNEDTFNYETGGAETTANVTLDKAVYDDDTDTITILSDLSTDSPLFSTYNTSTRLLDITGLTVSENRTLTVAYDVDALEGSDAINTIVGRLPWIWLLVIIAFSPAALVAIFTGRA